MELEKISKEELLSIKGGQWVYCREEDTWYWVEPTSLDPF